MERNRNIDIIRALSILIILAYHIFAITQVGLVNGRLSPFLAYAGEYGVTMFFIISGFSIYKSLQKRKDDFNYKKFMTDRLIRILPQYYISLIILMLLTSENSVVLFSKGQVVNLVSHLLLFHGFYPSLQGSISGVAWTLTPIFAFYLVSPLLFKAVEKKPKLTLIGSIIFACLSKVIIFSLLAFSITEQPSYMYFGLGRIILCSIDEFVIGMFLAKYITTPKDNKKIVLNIALIVLTIVSLYGWICIDKGARCTNCLLAYIWYSVLSVILAVGIYGFSQIKLPLENPISKMLLFISKHEYGIYLWHLEVIKFFGKANPYIAQLAGENRRIVYLYLGIIAIGFGILMDVIVESVDWKKTLSKCKDYYKVAICTCVIIFGIILLKQDVTLIKGIGNNIASIKENGINFVTPSEIIAENAKDKIPEDKKYVYIDNRETGYQYFWEIRYFLSPRESEHINSYINVICDGSIDEIFEKLKSMDVDYFLVKNCKNLEEAGIIEPDSVNGTVYEKNKDANNIEELFQKID